MNRESPPTMLERAEKFIKQIFSGQPPFATFSRELNGVLSGGLFPGKLYAIEGPPDGTKSSLAIQMMDKMAEELGVGCLFISSVLSAYEIYLRSIARISRQHSGEIEGKAWLSEDWISQHGKEAPNRFKSGVKDADEVYRKFAQNIVVQQLGAEGLPVSEVETAIAQTQEFFRAKRELMEPPPIAVFIDTLQGLRYPGQGGDTGEPTQAQLVRMLKELKAVARRTGCPIVALVDGVAFGRLYLKAGILPSTHGHELGFTAYHSDATILIETDDTLLSDAIQELYNRGQDTDAARLEEARSRFPLSNPKISPFIPTYAKMTLCSRGAGAVRNLYFIYLKAVGEFLDVAFRREMRKVYE